jgi:hypothetical protein
MKQCDTGEWVHWLLQNKADKIPKHIVKFLLGYSHMTFVLSAHSTTWIPFGLQREGQMGCMEWEKRNITG